ncbi:MAG: hypothetical protein ACOCRX_07340 [Candidatus Woesearchaeota archaeon]
MTLIGLYRGKKDYLFSDSLIETNKNLKKKYFFKGESQGILVGGILVKPFLEDYLNSNPQEVKNLIKEYYIDYDYSDFFVPSTIISFDLNNEDFNFYFINKNKSLIEKNIKKYLVSGPSSNYFSKNFKEKNNLSELERIIFSFKECNKFDKSIKPPLNIIIYDKKMKTFVKSDVE